MTQELTAILHKRSWTGDEIGKAILYSLVDAHRQTMQGIANPTPVFSPEQLRVMVGSLVDPAQIRRYNSYVGLQNWLIQYQAVATAYDKQTQGELAYFSSVLKAALAVEAEQKQLAFFPVLMTEKQYQKSREAGLKAQLEDDTGNDRTYSVIRLLGHVIAYLVSRLYVAPKEPNPLEDIRRQYEQEPVAAARVLSLLQKDENNGKNKRSEAPLTKWDVVKEGLLPLAYPALKGKEWETFAEQAIGLQADFPELCEACLREMEAALCGGMPTFTGLPPKEWNQTACSLRELYDQNLFGMKDVMEKDRFLFADNPRAAQNGVAVVQPGSPMQVDANGHYVEQIGHSTISIQCGLEQYTPANPDCRQAQKRAVDGRQAMEDGYYYVKGYDKAIELIADFLEMPSFAIFQLDGDSLAAQMEAMNESIAQLAEEIDSTPFADPDRMAFKQAALQKYFAPVDLHALEIPEKAVKEAAALLRDNLRAFDKQDSTFISILTTRRGEAQ